MLSELEENSILSRSEEQSSHNSFRYADKEIKANEEVKSSRKVSNQVEEIKKAHHAEILRRMH